MPRKSRLKLAPLKLGKENVGRRIARFRKERGYTQEQLARKIGIIQNLVSAYELGNLQLKLDMAIRFAKALNVSMDELIGVKTSNHSKLDKISLKLIRRMQKIEALPPAQEKVLLQTIDAFLKGVQK